MFYGYQGFSHGEKDVGERPLYTIETARHLALRNGVFSVVFPAASITMAGGGRSAFVGHPGASEGRSGRVLMSRQSRYIPEHANLQ
jgi:hypothetical protein